MNFLYDWKCTAIQLLFVIVSFGLGKFGLSSNWLTILIAGNLKLIELRNNRFKQVVTQISTDTINERDLILSRLDDLPYWVTFPDYEKTEWLNRILKKLWPCAVDKLNDLVSKIGTINDSVKITELKFGQSVNFTDFPLSKHA
jgi:Ca2+-dependent lipid-binding protein